MQVVQMALNITLLVLNIANVLLHGTGSYLLGCIYKQGKRSAQKIFIINLSVCELIMNLMECLRRILDFVPLSGRGSSNKIEFQHYLLIIMFTGISFVFYMDMIFITLDRLLNILLNVRYRIYCNHTKAKYLLLVTWLLGIVICLSVSLAHYFTEYVWEAFFFMYFYPTVEISFIILALVTYAFIFKQYHKSHRIPTQRTTRGRQQNGGKPESAFQVFRMSRFFVSILLITSFIIFMLIPDLVYLFYGVLGNNESSTLLACCWISYAISNLMDGWVYIFMQSTVKSLLRKKVKQLCRCTGYVHGMQNTMRMKMLSRNCNKEEDIARRRRRYYCSQEDVAYQGNYDHFDEKETETMDLSIVVPEQGIYVPI
jgi:hypothetical protein